MASIVLTIPSDIDAWPQSLLEGNDSFQGTVLGDTINGYKGADTMWGYGGNDIMHGMYGSDEIVAGGGDDNVRGGHGHDNLWGDAGADFLWGGIGLNQLLAGDGDNAQDLIYVSSDYHNNKSFGNPGGANRDLIWELGLEDKLYIHGVEDSSLTFQDGFDPIGSGNLGVAVYSNNILEAFVVTTMSVAQIDNITEGGFYA